MADAVNTGMVRPPTARRLHTRLFALGLPHVRDERDDRAEGDKPRRFRIVQRPSAASRAAPQTFTPQLPLEPAFTAAGIEAAP